MKRRKREAKSMKLQSSVSSVRATISFPSDLYATLEEIAKQKRVSLAWVVRDAAERYVADQRQRSDHG
jgi:metal-responsive CopG/Arc/MetJ family transcriptional regulator